MRALIISVLVMIASVVWLIGPARADEPSIKFASSLTSESGNTGLTTTDSATTLTKVSSVDLTSGTIRGEAGFRAGVDRVDPNYSRDLIIDHGGLAHPLSDDFTSPESRLRVGCDVYISRLTFNFDAAETLDTTPFPGSSAKLLANFDNYELGAKWTIGFLRADYQAGPISYFIDPDTFQTLQRPTRNLEDRVSAAWQQILSERIKVKSEVFSGEKPNSRPPFSGGEFSLAYALGDESAFIGKTGIAVESRNSALYDDRGYFAAAWSQIEYRLEPNYRWSLSAVLGTILETETARGPTPEQKVGTDSIGLTAQTRGHLWELGLKALGSLSNTGYQSLLVAGDFTWQI